MHIHHEYPLGRRSTAQRIAGNKDQLGVTDFKGMLLHNLHIDMGNAAAYTVAITSNSTKVVQVLGGQVTTLIDLTRFVGPRLEVPLGGSTVCSDTDVMWVAVRPRGGARAGAFVVHVSLPERKVVGVSKPLAVLPDWLWALCEDSPPRFRRWVGGCLVSTGGLTHTAGSNAHTCSASLRLPVALRDASGPTDGPRTTRPQGLQVAQAVGVVARSATV